MPNFFFTIIQATKREQAGYNSFIVYSIKIVMTNTICVFLRDLIPFVKFEKPEKRPWRSVTFGKLTFRF